MAACQQTSLKIDHPPRQGDAPIPDACAFERIAILHADNELRDANRHAIFVMEATWRRMGVEVVHLYGCAEYEPADLIFLHVDRSCVFDEYRDFARRYPAAVNLNGLDIRKRASVDGLLSRGDSYNGPVIVKTDRNFAGLPERYASDGDRTILGRIQNKLRRVHEKFYPPIASKADYFIAQTPRDVSRRFFGEDYVVQQFRPERRGEVYVLREYLFLFDQHYEMVQTSPNAIFNEDVLISLQPFTPSTRLLDLRDRLGLDFGKIDYAIIDGEPFVFDVNKTPGLSPIHHDPDDPFLLAFEEMAAKLALQPAAAAWLDREA